MSGDSQDDPSTVQTQLAVIRVQLDQLIKLNETRGQDHETRLRKLEERKFPLPTVAVLMSLVSTASSVIMYVSMR